MVKHLILTFAACCTIIGCTAFDDDYFTDHHSETQNIVTNKFQVHQKSAEYFAHKVSFDDNVTRSVSSVEPLAHGKDTLLYVVNFSNNNGWIVLSGDKRTESILASSKTGQFDLNHLGGSAVWMQEVAEKIYGVKRANHQDTTSTAYKNWCCIDTLALNLQKRPITKNTRSVNTKHPKKPYDPSDPSRYEDILVDTSIKITEQKEVGHLIQTHWGQTSPWDKYAPFVQNTEEHCPTGCVAVAGAQKLYYFHQLKGIPQVSYTQIKGGGNSWDAKNYHYSYSFDNPTASAWEDMATEAIGSSSTYGTDLVSILMMHIGSQVNMVYTKDGSSAKAEKLLEFYHKLGIKCDYSNYDEKAIRKSLDNNIPVNIFAHENRKWSTTLFFFNGKWRFYNGHAWIIDGYKDVMTTFTQTYNRRPILATIDDDNEVQLDDDLPVQDNENDYDNFHLRRLITPKPITPKFGIYTKTQDTRSYYWKMNFGWSGNEDDGLYLTEDTQEWKTSYRTYRYNKTIIHNFQF